MGLIKDARTIYERDPAARSILEVFLLYPGFKALYYHRLSSFFYRHKLCFFARYLSQRAARKTGIEIHPAAKIGEGLFIDHGHGVVIGETAVIGNNCTIYHQVTLGGTGREKGKKRHPSVGDNVLIGAGAKILGPVTIGDNSLVGAGSTVLEDVPANSTVTGNKARLIKTLGQRVEAPSVSLEQTKGPDPMAQEIGRLLEDMNEKEKKIQCMIDAINDRFTNLDCEKCKIEREKQDEDI